MSNPLADAIRSVAAKGPLSLNIFTTSDGTYQASISSDRKAFWVKMHADPYEALLAVLEIPSELAGVSKDAGVFG